MHCLVVFDDDGDDVEIVEHKADVVLCGSSDDYNRMMEVCYSWPHSFACMARHATACMYVFVGDVYGEVLRAD